ncbi:MAG TPA: thioredoxin domain-containing protein [Solirubrobacteraceae bacterium]|nr:thioredoxin domain-containing protein [Solirubrobacteraceae bacterium]
MASRAQQKEQARQRRLAAEQEAAAAIARMRRMQMIIGVVLIALVVVGVAVAISSGGSSAKAPTANSAAAKAAKAQVDSLLAGIPQSGNRLGSPAAKVTVTEFGDLECPICKDFALGAENQLIANDVKSGKVQLIYRSLCTATCNFSQAVFPVQQSAALAAGLQGHEWDYVELFYHEQGPEGTGYVTNDYLNGLASQVTGLNYTKWLSDRSSQTLASQVSADEQEAAAKGFQSTPTIVVQGPKGQAQPQQSAIDYPTLESMIKSVS